MPKKWHRKKEVSKTSEESGQTQATAKIDHAFASSGGKAKKRELPKLSGKLRSIVVGVVVLGLLAVGVGLYMTNRQPKTEVAKPYITAEGVAIRKLNETDLQAEVGRLLFEKKFDSAQQLIKFQDNAASEQLQSMLATAFVNQGAHDKALKVWQDMDQNNVGQKWQVLRNIGNEYEQLGDKQNALTHYQKAQDELRQTENVPVKEDEIHFLDRDIKRVGG